MKTKNWTIIIVGLLITISSCKKDLNEQNDHLKELRLALQPDSLTGQDAVINVGSNMNDGKSEILHLYVDYSVNLRLAYYSRVVINFDLSSIPDSARIDSAFLCLFISRPSRYTGKEFCVERITSNWDENSITFNTHPTFTFKNHFSVPKSQQDQDFPHINVTTLVQDMINDKENSYGFLLRYCFCEVLYMRTAVDFGSSNNKDENRRPYIVVYYSLRNR